MPSPSSTPRRFAARLLLLTTLLLGLFLMHGAPMAAGTGCHSDAPAPAQHVMAMTPTAQQAAHQVTPPVHHPTPSAQQSPGMAHSTVNCLALPARNSSPLPLLSLLPALPIALPLGPGRAARRRLPARRGPPRGGRELLLQVCVARN